MYSPDLMRFLLNLDNEEKTSKTYYNFNDGNKLFDIKQLAEVTLELHK